MIGILYTLLKIVIYVISAIIGVLAILSFFLRLPTKYDPKNKENRGYNDPKTTVHIVVLGDIGRSPRMQYHALSVAKHGGEVFLIGYYESEAHPDIVASPRITIVPVPSHQGVTQLENPTQMYFELGRKIYVQIKWLWRILGYELKPAEWVLVQVPPALPTLFVAALACALRKTKLMIDWHNFESTILSLRLGRGHPLVVISDWFEAYFSRFAHMHLAVTKVMCLFLARNFRLPSPVSVLADRPMNDFQPILDEKARREVWNSLPAQIANAKSIFGTDKYKVLVSSTSWTPDEDFQILLDALCQYSTVANTTHKSLPPVLVIITGKGPERDMYIKRIADLERAGCLKKVGIFTGWFTTKDYANLMACASLGVSLHTSSSGMDLPMKVLDMFGAGLPVIGWGANYPAWPELLKEGYNGMSFGSTEQLAAQLVELFGNPAQLAKLKQGALNETTWRWDNEWDRSAGRFLGFVP